MGRNLRAKRNHSKTLNDKIIIYSAVGVAVLAIIVFALVMYSKNLSDDVRNSTMSLEEMTSIAQNNAQNIENTQSASTDMGKTVEESKNEISTKNAINNTTTNSISNNTTNNVNTNASKNTTKSNTNMTKITTSTANANNNNSQTSKELSFEKPVEGEIVKEYAKDNLIYSETLKEWVTHMGIDIKADKTTVVKAAEAGTVKSIKNDPRYGLTIVIEHSNNMQTVYSNLLTSEFVVEGEKVEKGQSIGTVGNTAVFEIADEPHVHFEILKDSIPEDPSIYIK